MAGSEPIQAAEAGASDLPGFASYAEPEPGPEPGTWTIDVHPGWLQGRTLFGGAAYAAASSAMRGALEQAMAPAPAPQLRSMTYAFVGPVVAGPATIRAQVDRVGKSVSFCSAVIEQDGVLGARAMAAYGDARPSDIDVPATAPDVGRPVEDCFLMPYVPGITPDFTQGFEFRWASDLPYSGSENAETKGYIRYTSPVRGEAAVIALLDAWPPMVLPVTTTVTPASSVMLIVDLLADCRDVDGQQWFTFAGKADSARGGFGVESCVLAQDGVPLALVRQVIATYTPRQAPA